MSSAFDDEDATGASSASGALTDVTFTGVGDDSNGASSSSDVTSTFSFGATFGVLGVDDESPL